MEYQIKRKLKEDWVKALRSGKYEQGTKFLRRDNDKFCCLGVLCDITEYDKWIKDDNEKFYNFGKGTYSLLPINLIKLIGYGIQGDLVRMNDGGETFDKIADYIEANVPVDEDEIEKVNIENSLENCC